MDNLTADLFSSQTLGVSSMLTIIVTMVLALALGCAIAWVYRRNYRGVMYLRQLYAYADYDDADYRAGRAVHQATRSRCRWVWSARFPIVRFRTAVKDPLDTAYMFWALTTGILLGAGQFLLTVVAMVLIAIMMTAAGELSSPRASTAICWSIRASAEAERSIVAARFRHSHSEAEVQDRERLLR